MADTNGEKPKAARSDRKATDLDRRIGPVIRRLREALDISLEKAAELAGWDYSRARRLEVGSSKVTYNDAHHYLNTLGVPLTAFYRDKDLGFVVVPTTSEDSILTDPDLDARRRQAALVFIRTLKQQVAEDRAAGKA